MRFVSVRTVGRLAWALALVCCAPLIVHAEAKRDAHFEAEVRQFLERHPDFLLRNPDLMERTAQLAREREAQQKRVRTAQRLDEAAPLLQRLSRHLGEGAATPSIQILAFTDYECLPCRANDLQLHEIIRNQPDVRVIYAPLGILSAASAQASSATLAAMQERKSLALHRALMKAPLPLDYDVIMKQAVSTGIPLQQLASDMRSGETDALREQLRTLSDTLGVAATPTYLVACELIRGPITPAAISDARKTCEREPDVRRACCSGANEP